MVVRIRLQRFGRKKAPFYRVVVARAQWPRDGKYKELVGTYNPIAAKDGTKEVRLNTQRIKYWLSVGAQPSERVAWLLGQAGVIPEPPRRQSVQRAVPKAVRREQAAGLHTSAGASGGRAGAALRHGAAGGAAAAAAQCLRGLTLRLGPR